MHTLSQAPPTSTPASERPPLLLQVTAAVQKALGEEPTLSSGNIEIQVSDGHVVHVRVVRNVKIK